MQLGGLDFEVADHRQDRLGDQARPVGVEEPVEGAADPVVVERFGVTRLEPEDRRVVGRRPLTQGVDRTVTGYEVAHHHLDYRCRGQPQPGVVVGQVGRQVVGHSHPGQEEVDDRQRPQVLTVQRELPRCAHGGPP